MALNVRNKLFGPLLLLQLVASVHLTAADIGLASAGKVTIHQNGFCDLDNGREVPDNSRGEADFLWAYRPDLVRGELLPMNISAFALLNSNDFSAVSLENLRALSFNVGGVKRNGALFTSCELFRGEIYGYITHSHRYGKLFVESTGQSLVISFVTFSTDPGDTK